MMNIINSLLRHRFIEYSFATISLILFGGLFFAPGVVSKYFYINKITIASVLTFFYLILNLYAHSKQMKQSKPYLKAVWKFYLYVFSFIFVLFVYAVLTQPLLPQNIYITLLNRPIYLHVFLTNAFIIWFLYMVASFSREEWWIKAIYSYAFLPKSERIYIITASTYVVLLLALFIYMPTENIFILFRIFCGVTIGIVALLVARKLYKRL